MEVITPTDLTVLSSNIVETLYSEYDYTGATTYNAGDRVKISYLSDGTTEIFPHQLYDNLATSTTYPPTNPTKWVYVSSTNRHKMFDGYVNRQTESDAGVGYVETEIDSSRCNRLGFANVDTGKIEITVTDLARDNVWEYEVDMRESGRSTSWSTYFFGERTYKDYLMVSIPPFYVGKAKAKIIAKSPASGTAKCGILRAGKAFYIGLTQYDAEAGIISYSKKDTNKYGETYLNPGSKAKRLDIEACVPISIFSSVQRKMAAIDGQAVFFNANNPGMSQSAFTAYSFLREFREIYKDCAEARFIATIEGLI